MMGSRGTRGGGEIDCLSHNYRRMVRYRMKGGCGRSLTHHAPFPAASK
jgi:hypothetical protein